MVSRLCFAVLASAMVMGCSSIKPPEEQWSKAGATTEDVKRDIYWCTTVRRDFRRADVSPIEERAPTRSVDTECMEGRGYTKR